VSRLCVVTVRGPKPFALLDVRHSRFVLDQDGELLLSATKQAADALAARIFNGESVGAR